jgi:hypothetical protein
MQPVEWKSGKNTLRGMVHSPRKQTGVFALFAHGFTSQRMGPEYLFVRLSRRLAEESIASLRFDFSGCGESDGAFADVTVSGMCADIISASKYCKKQFSPRAIVLIGHSLGGTASAMVCREIDAATVILLAPVASPLAAAQRYETVQQRGKNARGFYELGPHELSGAILDDMNSIDPVANLSRQGFNGPMLVFQGDEDPTVSVKEAGRFVHWADGAGVTGRFVVVPGADHNFSSVHAVDTLCTEIVSWIQERVV